MSKKLEKYPISFILSLGPELYKNYSFICNFYFEFIILLHTWLFLCIKFRLRRHYLKKNDYSLRHKETSKSPPKSLMCARRSISLPNAHSKYSSTSFPLSSRSTDAGAAHQWAQRRARHGTPLVWQYRRAGLAAAKTIVRGARGTGCVSQSGGRAGGRSHEPSGWARAGATRDGCYKGTSSSNLIIIFCSF